MSDRGDFLSGLIVGGLLGFAAGILFAPASGQETRDNIVNKGKELAGDVKEFAGEVKERKDEIAGTVRAKTEELFKVLRERLPKTKEVSDALDRVEKESPGVA